MARQGEVTFPAPLKAVAGDEVQGLLTGPAYMLDIVVRLADELHPVGLSWGLGLDALEAGSGRRLHGPVTPPRPAPVVPPAPAARRSDPVASPDPPPGPPEARPT